VEAGERRDGWTDEPRRFFSISLPPSLSLSLSLSPCLSLSRFVFPRARRNIKLNKRSIFCSLFLIGVELRHFATLFPPHSTPRPSFADLPLPPLYYPLPLSLPRALPPFCFPPAVPLSATPFCCFSSSSSSSSFLVSSCSLFRFSRLPLALWPVRRNEPRRGEALYQSRVRSAWFIFYFGRGPNCKINTSS